MLKRRKKILPHLLSILFFLVPIFVLAVDFNGFIKPLENYIVGNGFGVKYNDRYIGHLGEDYIVPAYKEVRAVAKGRVVRSLRWPLCDEYQIIDGKKKKVANSHGWGGVVIIEHNIEDFGNFDSTDSIITSVTEERPTVVYSLYGHLKNIKVDNGKLVEKGDVVGEIADMCIYVPHLHFEIKDTYAFQNDILDGVGQGYSGVENYAPHHYSPLKFIELNKDLVIGEEKSESTPEQLEPSWWDRIIDLFIPDSKNTPEEIRGEQIEDKVGVKDKEQTNLVYNLDFTNTPRTIQATPGQDLQVAVKFKNTGTRTFERGKISVNVVGGIVSNAKFRHSSWVTDLRPAILDQNIESGQNGAFSFVINVPDTVGRYVFQIMAIENGVWRQIGNDLFILNLDVVEDIVEESVETNEEDEIKDNGFWNNFTDVVKGIKETAEDVVDDMVETVKKVFYGGGGGGGSSPAPPKSPSTFDESTVDIGGTGEEQWFSITMPSTTPWITNLATTTISGGKASVVEEIFIDNSSEGVEYTSSTFWQKELNLTEGENAFELHIEDEEGQAISGANFVIIVDTITPAQPIVQLAQSGFTTPTMYISWQSTDEGAGIEYFEVQYKRSTNEDWSMLLDQATSTSHTMEVEHLSTYSVRVRAVDKAGNYSLWSDENIEALQLTIDWPKDIVINEIAWAGVSNINDCNEEEWIELYNPGEEDLLLDGWSLIIDGSPIPLLGTILASGYYLIEKDEDVITSIEADALFSSGIELPDTGANIVLQNSEGETIDETNQSTGWWGGSAESKHHSMERVSSAQPGNEIGNWQTNASVRYSVRSQCGTVYGSPKINNNTYWYLSDLVNNYDFDENNTLILTAEHNPYILGYDATVPENYTLQIESGVVVVGVAGSASLIAQGNVVLNGTEDSLVVFTSARDNDYGNWYAFGVPGSLSSTSPQTGDWRNIIIRESGSLTGKHTKFLYGGDTYKYGSCFVCYAEQVIRNEGGKVNLSYTDFNSTYIKESNDNYDAYIWSDGGDLEINNSAFANGYRAVMAEQGTEVDLNNNIFSNFNYIDKYPVELKNVMPTSWSRNTFGNNFYNGAYVSTVIFDENYTLEPNNNLLFSGITISPSSTLTLSPGSQVNLTASAWMTVEGVLNSQGTEDSPVNISPDGNFGALVFKNSTSNLSYTNILNGGYHNTYPISGTRDKASVWVENSELTLDNVSITNSRRPGYIIYSQNSNLDISNSILGWYEEYDKLNGWFDNGIKLKDSNLYLNNVDFHKIDFAVDALGDYSLTYENMSEENFIDMYYHQQYKNWMPASLFDFELWD